MNPYVQELAVGDKIIKFFSINFEFDPECVLSGSLGLIHGVDMVRDGNSLSLPILIHRKPKHSPQEVIKVGNGQERCLQIHQDETYHKQTLQISDLVVDPPHLVGSA